MQRRQQTRKQSEKAQEEQSRLKHRLNTQHELELLAIAKHFGKRPSATKSRVTEITSDGVTIEWEWPQDDKPQTEEMMFAFRNVTGPASALQEISDLATEAFSALGIKDKPRLAQTTVDSGNMVDFSFKMPSPTIAGSVIAGFACLFYVAFAENAMPPFNAVSQGFWYYVFVGAVGVHMLEAVAVFLICQLIRMFQPRQMDFATQLKWTAGGLCFGLFCLHPFFVRLRLQFEIADAIAENRAREANGSPRQ